MTFRRALIRALDRPGGRGLLGFAGTRLARRFAPTVRVRFHRGMWVHESSGTTFVDAPAFDYHPPMFRFWAAELERCHANVKDHWGHVYRPLPGSVIVDVGAGRGEDAIAFSSAVGSTGRVIAIEAHPVTFRCLRLFTQLNRLDNVRPLNYAIVDQAGPVAIDTRQGWQANTIKATGATTVPGLPLDEVVEREGIDRIDLLKMNIEGAEREAVLGMERTFRITRALCISCHDFRANSGDGESFRTKELVRRAVERAGFTIVSRDSDPRPYIADQVNGIRE